jgi:MFS transporter, FSR family, fosmidomycin resistance protein
MTDKDGTMSRILTLSSAHVVTDLYLPALTAILPLLIGAYGLSYFLAGLLVTAYNLTSSMMQPVFGWLSDTYGFFIHISASLLISAVFLSAMGFTADFPLLLFFAALAALGHAAFHPNALSIVSSLCSPDNRGKLTATFVVGGNLGYAAGPILTAAVVSLFGLHGLPVLIIPAALMAVILWRFYPISSMTVKPRRADRAGDPAPPDYRPLAVLFCASTLRAWAIFCAIAFFPPFLMDRGLDLISAELLVTGMLLAGVAGQIAGGYLSDTYGRKEYVIAGSIISIPAFFLFFFTTGDLSVCALLLFGFALWSGMAVTVAIAHELVPGRVALASGLMLGASLGAGGLGVAATGILADRYSLGQALGIIPVVILISLIFVWFLKYPWKMLGRAPDI